MDINRERVSGRQKKNAEYSKAGGINGNYSKDKRMV